LRPGAVRTGRELVATSQEFLDASGQRGGGEARSTSAGGFQPIARIREAAAELGVPW